MVTAATLFCSGLWILTFFVFLFAPFEVKALASFTLLPLTLIATAADLALLD
jgi:hypothetical protein